MIDFFSVSEKYNSQVMRKQRRARRARAISAAGESPLDLIAYWARNRARNCCRRNLRSSLSNFNPHTNLPPPLEEPKRDQLGIAMRSIAPDYVNSLQSAVSIATDDGPDGVQGSVEPKNGLLRLSFAQVVKPIRRVISSRYRSDSGGSWPRRFDFQMPLSSQT